MPQLIQHIDAIARRTQRDVLLVQFHDGSKKSMLDYALNPVRQFILDWFDANGIPYEECGDFADENSLDRYRGQIYIDVPYDNADQEFQKVCTFLENPANNELFKGARFCFLTLAQAMKNSHHDEPGFWDRWDIDF